MLIGIVGKTNVGKSTFFKALSMIDVEISNRTFVTIKPNQGVGFVTTPCVCRKFNVSCNPKNSKCRKGIRHIPVRLLDVAGLVRGAHAGRGLGNRFLDDLRQADGLIHVVDISGSTNENGEAVPHGSYNPENDIKFLPEEIDEWFFGILEKNWDKFSKQVQHQGKELEKEIAGQLSGLKITERDVSNAIKALGLGKNPAEWDREKLRKFSKKLREDSKKMVIAGNKVDLQAGQKFYEILKGKYDIVPCSAEGELALREAEQKGLIDYIPGQNGFSITGSLNEKQEKVLNFIKANILDKYGSTGVQDCLNRLVFGVLGYIAVYPVASIARLSDKQGNVLPDVHLVRKGTTLREFASIIHTTLAQNFIGGMDTGRKKIGADYELRGGDVVEILFRK